MYSVRQRLCSSTIISWSKWASTDPICLTAADCSISGTTTITASADATALASCTTFSGSVAIQTDLSTPLDSNGHQQIQVDNVQKIAGNLTVIGLSTLTFVSFNQLVEVTGGMLVGFLSGAATLNFPSISRVKQLNLTALPVLQQLNFGTVGVTKAQSILITNTGLSSLDGLNNLEAVDSLDINNNQALQNITMKKITNISKSLSIVDNNGLTTGLNVNFPSLQTAQNMTFRNCSDIKLPALQNVTEDLGFYGNAFTSFSADNLTTLGSLILDNNAQLTNVTFSSVTSINGSFTINDNPKLNVINGFPVLQVIGGALGLSGNFTEYVFVFPIRIDRSTRF